MPLVRNDFINARAVAPCVWRARRLESVDMSERRRFPRYLYDGEAHLSQGPDGPVAVVEIQSISVSGCRVGTAIVPAVGQKCELRIDWRGRQFRNDVVVVWKKPKVGAGLNFPSVDEDNLVFLRNLCRTLLLEPLAPLPPEPERTI